MPVKRGDVILAYVPNVGSPGGKDSGRYLRDAEYATSSDLTAVDDLSDAP